MKKVLHGEAVIRSCELPKDAKKLEIKKNYFVIADSETTGNDHRVSVCDDVEIYEKDGTLYIKNDVETDVYCPNKQRHGTATLPKGTWEIGIAKEFDYLADNERNVAD